MKNGKRRRKATNLLVPGPTSIFLLLFFATAALGDNSKLIENQSALPDWFWNQPYGSDYAVGICQPCLELPQSFEIARTNAIWEIVRQREMRVSTTSGTLSSGTGVMHAGRSAEFLSDTAEMSNVASSSRMLDSAYVDDMVIVLVGPSSTAGRDSLSMTVDISGWEATTPKSDELYFAVGKAPLYYYFSSTWEEALADALIELTHELSTTATSRSLGNEDDVAEVTRIEGDALLRDWRVIARSFDQENEIFQVIIGMRK